MADFFGRVKDKAGDLERTLKEKDRHGTNLLCLCNQLLLMLLKVFN